MLLLVIVAIATGSDSGSAQKKKAKQMDKNSLLAITLMVFFKEVRDIFLIF